VIPPTPVLTTITLSPTTASLTAGGSTQTISATKLDQNSSPITATLTWNSSNTSVATVSSSGVVTPLTAGTTNITATSGGITSNTATISVTTSGGSSSTLSQGLVAYYPFDGDANDASGNNNNGTAVNSPTYVAGQIGQAISFDGSNGVAIGTSPSFTDSFSLSLWVKKNNTIQSTVFSNYNGYGGNELSIRMDQWSTNLYSPAPNISTTPISDNYWHHMVVIRDSVSGSVTFYVEGVQVGIQTGPTGIISYGYNGYLVIGGKKIYGTMTGSLTGLVDDVRIYNRALSASEVGQLYNGTLSYHAPTTSQQNQSLLASISAALSNLINEFKKYISR
jgi:hypothetical protein